MQSAALPLLDSFTALADPTRCRMLVALERHDLTVSELCNVLQLPQSTVSRHLKMLADAGLVASRREGTSRFYSLAVSQGQGPTSNDELWQLARREFVGRPAVAQDGRRLERVLAARGAASRQFFATTAGQWDRVRDELFGDQFYWRPLFGLLPSTWVVADLGCGTGTISGALAQHVARVIGVDASDEMLKAAAERSVASNIDWRLGPLEALPIEAGSLDAATLVLVLHHLPAPGIALAEALRVLKPGGRLLIVDMAPHEREDYRQQMGHVWLGFSEEQVTRLLEQAGFCGVKYHAIPAVAEAKGPGLFAVSATKDAPKAPPQFEVRSSTFKV